MSRTDDIRGDVRDAWDFWLSQHDISVPEPIHDAVREAVTAWLDEHGPDLLGERANP